MPETPEYDDPLSEASTSPDILAALIKALAKPECAAATIDEIFELLPPFDQNAYIQFLKDYNQPLNDITPDNLTNDDWMGKTMHRLNCLEHENNNRLNFHTISIPLLDPIDKADFSSAFESAHTLWKEADSRHPGAFKHPLAPIVEECLKAWAPKVEMERRPARLFPKDLESSRSVEVRERLPIGTPHTLETTIQGELPSLETDTVLVPALPLEVYRADGGGRGGQGAGTGAPGDEMIWINSIVSVPREPRLYTTGVKITPTLREVLEYRYPNGWNRGKQLPRLIEDFHRIHNKRIVWERVAINIVQVYKAPTMTTQLDDHLEIVIRFPEGFKGQNGPMIDMALQNQRGLRSATEWRAGLRLAYFWDNHKSPLGNSRYAKIFPTINKVLRNSEGYLISPNGQLILSGDVVRTKAGGWHAKNGNNPQKVWYHPWATVIGEERNPECDKIPPLTDDELIHLCYDDSYIDDNIKWKRLHDAKQTLYKMQDRGDIVIEENVICHKRGIKGWRIIETRPQNTTG